MMMGRQNTRECGKLWDDEDKEMDEGEEKGRTDETGVAGA